jgi:hypothetical protein
MSHTEQRERGNSSIHVDALLENFLFLLVFFFFSTMKISYMKEKPGLSTEREIIINASIHTLT